MNKILLVTLMLLPSLIFAQKNCEVTYISNEGFLFEIDGKKVLIDALFDEIKGNWCDSPSDSIIDLMKNSKHPFDSIDIVAITHKHIDHFNKSSHSPFSDFNIFIDSQIDTAEWFMSASHLPIILPGWILRVKKVFFYFIISIGPTGMILPGNIYQPVWPWVIT